MVLPHRGHQGQAQTWEPLCVSSKQFCHLHRSILPGGEGYFSKWCASHRESENIHPPLQRGTPSLGCVLRVQDDSPQPVTQAVSSWTLHGVAHNVRPSNGRSVRRLQVTVDGFARLPHPTRHPSAPQELLQRRHVQGRYNV